jgi:hypothetical protein
MIEGKHKLIEVLMENTAFYICACDVVMKNFWDIFF